MNIKILIEEKKKKYYLGKPLIYIQESKGYNRIFECQIYSSSPILVSQNKKKIFNEKFFFLKNISWRLNDQLIESNKHISITTSCDHYDCLSKLVYDYRRIISSSKTLHRISCIGENEFGIEQSRLYQINTSDGKIIFSSSYNYFFLYLIH